MKSLSTGISFVDSTMIPVCHNLRRYGNRVFANVAASGKGTMGWCHGFKLHFIYNDRGEIITFCLTGANVDDRDPEVWKVLSGELYGKLFEDRGYISTKLFEDGIQPVTGVGANMKNRLMPLWYRIIHGKRTAQFAHANNVVTRQSAQRHVHQRVESARISAPLAVHIFSMSAVKSSISISPSNTGIA